MSQEQTPKDQESRSDEDETQTGVLQAEPDPQAEQGDEPPPAQSEPDVDPPVGEAPQAAPVAGKPPARGPAWLALLLALAALGLSGWLGWQAWQQQQARQTPPWQGPLEQLSQQLRFLKEGETRQRDRIQALETQLQRALAARDDSLAELRRAQAGLQQRIDALEGADDRFENALVQLAQLKTGGDRAQALMEIEFLLRTAILRVELFGNRDLALRALEMASRHLAALDDPAYARVRVQVEAEIKALKAVAMPDLEHWLGLLAQLRQQQAQWPLKQAGTTQAGQPPAEAETGYWARLKRLAAELVKVKRLDEAPPLPANWQQAAHQALALQLVALESALAGQNPEVVRSLVAATRQWIGQQFDREDPRVKQALAELELLAQAPLQPQLPPMGQSLQQFRQVVARLRGQPAEVPVDEAGSTP